MNNTQNLKYNFWEKFLFFTGLKKRPVKVYFIPGMCNSCTVFDDLVLPVGYEKIYLEWYIPDENETLNEYARNMAKDIDVSRPFILVGYSLGAVVMQEMNTFLSPLKNIVISSMKSAEEIPSLFRFAEKVNFVKLVPKSVFGATKFITNIFTRFIYTMPTETVAKCMVITDPQYVRWAVYNITNWHPTIECPRIYHIHGTKDQIFPVKQIKNAYIIENGDHLMIMEYADNVSRYIRKILLEK